MSLQDRLSQLQNSDLWKTEIKKYIADNIDSIREVLNADTLTLPELEQALRNNAIGNYSTRSGFNRPSEIIDYLQDTIKEKRIIPWKRFILEKSLLELEAYGYFDSETDLSVLTTLSDDELSNKVEDISQRNKRVEDLSFKDELDESEQKEMAELVKRGLKTYELMANRKEKLKDYLKSIYVFSRNERPIDLNNLSENENGQDFILTVYDPSIYQIEITLNPLSDETPLFQVYESGGFGRFTRDYSKFLSGEDMKIEIGGRPINVPEGTKYLEPVITDYLRTVIIKPVDPDMLF